MHSPVWTSDMSYLYHKKDMFYLDIGFRVFTRYFFFSLIIKAACLGWEHNEIWKFKRVRKEKQNNFWQG